VSNLKMIIDLPYNNFHYILKEFGNTEMALFTSLVKHTLSKFIKDHKRFIISIVIFFSILIAFDYFLEKYTGDIVGPMLKEMVTSKSSGMYHADFGNMGYILNAGIFYVDDFSLTIDSATFRANQEGLNPVNIIFSSKVPRLYIQVTELWAIYLKRELHVKGIESNRPEIHILKLRDDTTAAKKKIDINDPYELISDYLTVFELNDFIIKNGSFKFHTPNGANHENYEINDISINIKNFLIDQKASKNKSKFFYTDNVEIEVRDQSVYLADSLHKISFDRFLISTIDKSVEIDNLIIEERPRVEEEVSIKSHVNRMFFAIPALRLNGINFIKAYNDLTLHVGKVYIERPTMKFVTARKDKKNGEKVNEDNKNQTFIIPHLISIDTIELKDAKIDLTLRNQHGSSRGRIDQFSFFAKKINLDSTALPGHPFTITYEDIALDIAGGKYDTHDKLHNLEFDSMTLYSNPTNIELTNLNFIARNPKNKAQTSNKLTMESDASLKLSFPKFQISDFDLPALLNGDTLKLSEILLDNPNVFLCTKDKVKDENPKPLNLSRLTDPYSFIKKSLKAVIIRDVILRDGQVKLVKCTNRSNPTLTVNSLNVRIANIALDSLIQNRKSVLGAENLYIGCNTLSYNFPENGNHLMARGVDFNSNTGVFNTVELKMSSKTDPSSLSTPQIETQIHAIKLTGIDLNKFFETSIASADNFSIGSVNLKLALHESGESKKKRETKGGNGIVRKFELNKLLIHSGKVDIKRNNEALFFTDNFNIELEKVGFYPGQKSSESIELNRLDLNLDNYSIFINKINHQLTADHLGLHSNSKTATATNLRLTPLSKASGENIYDIHIPAIRMSDIDIIQLLFDSSYSCSSLLISEPHIHLEINKKDTVQKQINKTNSNKKSLPHPLRMIHAGEIKLVNGDIKLQRNQKDNTQIIEVQNINFTLDNVDVDSSGLISSEKLLYAKNIDLQADYISFFQPDKQQFMNLNHLSFSTGNRLLEGSGLYYSNNTGKPYKDRNKLKVDLDEFKVTNLDVLAIFNDNYIDLGDITLTRPYLALEQMKKDKKSGTDKKSIKYVYPLDSTLIRSVHINSLVINNGKTRLTTLDSTESKHKLYVGGINLLVNDLGMAPKKLHTISTNSFVKSFDLNIGKVRYDLPDNLNRIQIGKISLNSQDTSLIISDFELIPKLGKYEFGPAKGFQSTWMRIKNKKITINNLHINKMLFENKLFASSIIVDGLQMFMFRDKRVPFVEIYKPLPQERLHKMALGLKLDSLFLNDGNIVFQQFAEKSKVPGEVYITGLNARIFNITNDSATLLKKPKMFLEARGAFADKGDINLQVVFDLVDTNRVFYMGAVVANLDLTEFNRMLVPTVFVKIKSGYDKNLILTAKANNEYSYGEMKFYYDDLKIALLNKETETPKGVGNALGSFFANSFFIKTNNPNLISVRKGEIFFERYKYKSIFNYWVKIFLSGVVTSIGAKSNKKQIKKLQDAQMKKYAPITTPD